MRYSITRKLNLGKRANLQYETVDFQISDCESPQQAEEELNGWIVDYLAKLQKKIEIQNEAPPFPTPKKETPKSPLADFNAARFAKKEAIIEQNKLSKK